jgi:hypothetical protein
MPVQAGTQSLLIQEVCNQTDTTAKHEQTVQNTHAQVVLCLFWREGAAVAEQVNKADGDATVNIEDQVVFLGGCNGLDGDGVVKKFVGGEVLDDEFFDELDTQIRVGARLDTVTDTGDYAMRQWVTLRGIAGATTLTYSACSPSSSCQRTLLGSSPCRRPW